MPLLTCSVTDRLLRVSACLYFDRDGHDQTQPSRSKRTLAIIRSQPLYSITSVVPTHVRVVHGYIALASSIAIDKAQSALSHVVSNPRSILAPQFAPSSRTPQFITRLVTHALVVIIMSGQASSSSSVRTLEQAEADNQRLLREGTAIQNELNALKQAMAQANQRHLAPAAAAAPAVHQPRLHRAKIPQPTMFAGKVGSSLDDWFTIVEKQFDYYRDEFPSDDEKIQYATGWINSDVTKYIIPVMAAGQIATFDAFKAAMKKRYQPKASSQRARNQLDTTRQTGSVDQYAELFQRLMAFIPNMADEDQVHQFIRGLKPTIKSDVLKLDATTLFECIEGAVKIEGYMSSSGAPPMNNSHRTPYVPRHSPSSAAPMDVSNVNFDLTGDDRESPFVSDTVESSRMLAMIQQQQQQINALLSVKSTARPAKKNHIQGITPDVLTKCMAAGLCLNCKEKGHMKSECTKPFRLNL